MCCLLTQTVRSQELTLLHPDFQHHPALDGNVIDHTGTNTPGFSTSIMCLVGKPAVNGVQDLITQTYHQPFFCEIEYAIEKRSWLAPRFRLGSLDYVNTLEGYR